MACIEWRAFFYCSFTKNEKSLAYDKSEYQRSKNIKAVAFSSIMNLNNTKSIGKLQIQESNLFNSPSKLLIRICLYEDEKMLKALELIMQTIKLKLV
jgi:hypothetical protein